MSDGPPDTPRSGCPRAAANPRGQFGQQPHHEHQRDRDPHNHAASTPACMTRISRSNEGECSTSTPASNRTVMKTTSVTSRASKLAQQMSLRAGTDRQTRLPLESPSKVRVLPRDGGASRVTVSPGGSHSSRRCAIPRKPASQEPGRLLRRRRSANMASSSTAGQHTCSNSGSCRISGTAGLATASPGRVPWA